MGEVGYTERIWDGQGRARAGGRERCMRWDGMGETLAFV